MFATPILLITFNRPEHTRRVLEAILKVNPKVLYVFQDGARTGCESDSVRCAQVRHMIDEMTCNAETEIHTYYAENNMGCGPGPAVAISWFFSIVNEGIIIEDDAVPHPDFFFFAQEMLERYRDDSSVRAIGSMNVDTRKWGNGSYYFTMMNRTLCAWATWKRAWLDFDLEMKDVKRRHLKRAMRRYGCSLLERSFWCDRLDDVHKNLCEGKSWDQQFIMSIWLHGGKGIIPNVNLSSNIGTADSDATHRMKDGNIIDNVPCQPILPLVHPESCEISGQADRIFHLRYTEPQRADWSMPLVWYYLINHRIKRLLGHEGPWIKKK